MAHSTLPGGKFKRLSFSLIREAFSRWIREQTDLVPPYKYYEGEVWGKHVESGLFYLELDGEAVEVDSVTYSVLEVGEAVKVRYTRRLRAISIDRFPTNGENGGSGGLLD